MAVVLVALVPVVLVELGLGEQSLVVAVVLLLLVEAAVLILVP